MPGKMALVDYNRCQPEQCESCAAAAACTRKLLVQEEPHQAPLMNPSLCKGCGDCIRACPLKAIIIATQ